MKRLAATPGPRYTGAQIQARLQALQKAWDEEGGFDEKRMLELLDELRARDAG